MRIAIHVFDGITTFHMAAAMLVFGEVSRLGLANDWIVRPWGRTQTVHSVEGLSIGGVADPQIARQADMLVFPSWHADGRGPTEEVVPLIREAHRRGVTIVGLCLGAFPVALSGVLDGRSAVTHWAATETLAAMCPEVEVDDAALYLDHGDVLTSAGTASALDACLHIVRSRLGASAAATVARRLVVAPHREGDQAQYVARPVREAETPGPIAEVTAWALEHIDERLNVASLARKASMSSRHFTRKFKETTGASPARWLQARRLDEARRLLEVTPWSIERIARASGFASPVTFRQAFTAAYATTPSSYRKRFAERTVTGDPRAAEPW